MSKVVHQDFFNFLFLGGGIGSFQAIKSKKVKRNIYRYVKLWIVFIFSHELIIL